MAIKLEPDQLDAIVVIERVCSILSLVGCAFILVTFVFFRGFRRPINRLVFYASVGNVLTNAATLVGRSGTTDVNGFLCQAQGFLIQMFMCADSFWTLAMACNVYLTFFHKFDAEGLRTMEKYYFIACYGLPTAPAFVYLFLTSPGKTRVYADATLWCWISPDWDILRIATFYGPVWVAIFATFVIYVRAGKEIYKKRKQLRNFKQPLSEDLVVPNDPFTSTKTTEVHVTSESVQRIEEPIDLSPLGDRKNRPLTQSASERPAYSVSVSTQQPHAFRTPASPTSSSTSYEAKDAPQPHMPVSTPRRHAAMEANNAAWSYTKVAVLFFTAMLVTWIPSSANRVYSVVHPSEISPQLQFASSFVLPLQGFWNAVIYITTSWGAVAAIFRDCDFSCFRGRGRAAVATGNAAARSNTGFAIGGGIGAAGAAARGIHRIGAPPSRGGKIPSTSSTTELASRPATRGCDGEGAEP